MFVKQMRIGNHKQSSYLPWPVSSTQETLHSPEPVLSYLNFV